MKKGVYKLDFDCGRQGSLTGLFIATDVEVEILVNKEIEVYFGEVLGKHSDVYGTIEKEEITLVSDNPDVVKVIENYDLSNGYNPFDEELNSIPSDTEFDGDHVQELVDYYIKYD